jgi:hypothetical protein
MPARAAGVGDVEAVVLDEADSIQLLATSTPVDQRALVARGRETTRKSVLVERSGLEVEEEEGLVGIIDGDFGWSNPPTQYTASGETGRFPRMGHRRSLLWDYCDILGHQVPVAEDGDKGS